MADFSIIATIIGIAGAGFRLSLVLNAVGVEMATADVEIQTIARAISEYAFTLKQLALTLESAKSIATQSAMETAKQIADQSQVVFNDIKEMTELDQKKDDHGHLQSIAVAQRVRWCFKKQRVNYLLGQLESLKLSLSIMLQVLQMGQSITRSRPFVSEDPSIVPPNEQAMLQEKAEIQNMVVVRHWSLVDLQHLYDLAQNEATERQNQHRIEIPPPRFDGISHTNPDPRLRIEGPKNDEDLSKALVKYNETPLENLDDSLNRALHRPNKLLRTPGDDIVDRLLDEWTRVRGTPPRKRAHKSRKYRPRYDTDSEDSEIDFERGDIGGRYIGAPPRKPRNVHFERARVESDSDESGHKNPRQRGLRHYVLDSDSVSTSTTESDSDSTPPRPPRRFSDGSRIKPAMQEFGNQNRRPDTSGGSPQSSRPTSRNGPQPAVFPRLGPIQNPSYPGQGPTLHNGPGSAGLRPPAPYNIAQGPQRMASSPLIGIPPAQIHSGLIPVSPGTSPNTRGMYFPPPPNQPPPQPYPPPSSRSHHKSSKRRTGVESRNGVDSRNGDKMTFKQNAKRDVKRGLIGAGAVAGLMDIIEGLGAI
ncbi:MAG: hypothetical protein Q9209_007656 [Squamulea sp. 1 TL-2023]